MGENGNWTDAPDWSSGNFKNYDENGKYMYGGGNNSEGGGNGCIVTLLVIAGSGLFTLVLGISILF